MKTYSPKPHEITRDWFVVDATGLTLGRLATRVADVLRGKHKPQWAPHVDTGDYVIVTNCDKLVVTGNKRTQKLYWRHSGYPGGIRKRTFEEQMERRPEEIIRSAVRGMLPRNKIGRQQLLKLKVYRTAEHPHDNFSPKPLTGVGA